MAVSFRLSRILLLFAGILALLGCTRSSPAPPSEIEPRSAAPVDHRRSELSDELFVREIQEGVFVITHAFPWPANSMLVEMQSSELVLVDTPYTPEATRRVIEWAASRWGHREIVAINTGFHYDNLGGNDHLIKQGIPVYGSTTTAQLLEERGDAVRALTLAWLEKPEDRRYRDVHAQLLYRAPTHLFDLEEGLELAFGDEVVRVYYPGPTHAPDNVVVYFPARKLLFGGCMILGGDTIGNTADADLAAWPDSVRNLDHFEVNVLVPGHGERLDPGLLEHTLALLTDVRE